VLEWQSEQLADDVICVVALPVASLLLWQVWQVLEATLASA
jgi:hypothetical protein